MVGYWRLDSFAAIFPFLFNAYRSLRGARRVEINSSIISCPPREAPAALGALRNLRTRAPCVCGSHGGSLQSPSPCTLQSNPHNWPSQIAA